MSRFTPTAIFEDPAESGQSSPTLPTTTTTSTSTTTTAAPETTTTTSSTSQSTSETTSTTESASSTDEETTSTTSASTTRTEARQTAVTTAVQNTPTTARVTASITQSTRTLAATTSITSITNTPTPSAEPSGVSTGSIVGIAAASILGVVLLIAGIMFVVRRVRKRQDEEFDDEAFRRQSVMLPEDTPSPLYRGNSNGSRGARPPTMIERHYAAYGRAQSPTGNAYGQGGQPFGSPNPYSDYQANRPMSPSFMPGQVISQPPMQQYGNPSPYFNPPTQSPVTAVPPYQSAYDDQGQLVRHASPANIPMPVQQPGEDYANLSRASVTPFQQAQYAEISRQLNIPPPVPQPEAIAEKLPSPFEDPREDNKIAPARPSSEFDPSHGAPIFPQVIDEPVPRIASNPPTLDLPQPTFSPVTVAFPGGQIAPSPMRSTFNDNSASMDPPLSPRAATPQKGQVVDVPTRVYDGRETPVQIEYTGQSPAPVTGAPAGSAQVPKNGKRPETMYDDEDAYGGM